MNASAQKNLEKLHALLRRHNITIAESYRSANNDDVALHAWPCGSTCQLKVYIEVLNHSALDKVKSTLAFYGYKVAAESSQTESVYLNVIDTD